LLGKNVYDVSPKDIADIYYRADLELFNNPGIQIYETLAADKTGIRHNVIFNKATYQDKNGNLAGLIGAIFDISDRKQAEEDKRIMEERLNRAEKMEALGTLAGGVAHDLNNVLGIVVGYAEMLMVEMDESNPMRDDLMKILEGGNRSAAIVQDLLTLARRGVQTQKVINLNTTITDYQKTPEFEAVFSLNRRVRLKTYLERDLLNIMGSPVHLGKTIINLVANAVEAMPGGGMLTITTSNQSLDKPVHGYDAVNEGDYVVLSVTDTGEGISDSDIKHIFEPFYTKKIMGRSGTGLGLAVVWGTVKDHNGYINVQSEVGRGTTIALYFPVIREEIAIVPTAIPLSDYIGNDESILVIDDIKEQRELAARILGKLNYKVKTVSSGEAAVKCLGTEKADLLVLDMIMDPGMDGLDTYKAIVEIHPRQKAIIVSGFSETDRVKEAKALGAGDYLRKPYVIERLGLAVRKELDR
jgi:signal transduction histidine kinase